MPELVLVVVTMSGNQFGQESPPRFSLGVFRLSLLPGRACALGGDIEPDPAQHRRSQEAAARALPRQGAD